MSSFSQEGSREVNTNEGNISHIGRLRILVSGVAVVSDVAVLRNKSHSRLSVVGGHCEELVFQSTVSRRHCE